MFFRACLSERESGSLILFVTFQYAESMFGPSFSKSSMKNFQFIEAI